MPRLLLVDDNSSIHKIAVYLLVSTDIELTHALSASEALALIDSEALFDAALIDTSMSEIDGWELLSRLRVAPKTTNMPIGIMTGILDEIDINQVKNAPIQAFLLKPVDLRDLAKSVKELIATPVGVSMSSQQSDTSVPSDLLILEEQDLLSEEVEETFTPTDIPDTEIQSSNTSLNSDAETAQSSDLLILEEQDLLSEEVEETFTPTDIPDTEIQSSNIFPNSDDEGAQSSDLLILEEQDLLSEEVEETFTPTDTPDTEIQSSNTFPNSDNEGAQSVEETILLDLEELNFKDIDQLVIAENEPFAKIYEANYESFGGEADNSAIPISVVESGALEESSEQTPEQTPASYLDTLPEDFDPTVFLEENITGYSEPENADESQDTSEKTEDIEQIAEGIHELLQREFETLPLDISDNDVDSPLNDTVAKYSEEPYDTDLQVTADTSETMLVLPVSHDEEDVKNVPVILVSESSQNSPQEQNALLPSNSSLVSELLADPMFIDAIVKAVIKKLDDRDIKV
jgi:CheY-like chemotaxis protein